MSNRIHGPRLTSSQRTKLRQAATCPVCRCRPKISRTAAKIGAGHEWVDGKPCKLFGKLDPGQIDRLPGQSNDEFVDAIAAFWTATWAAFLASDDEVTS